MKNLFGRGDTRQRKSLIFIVAPQVPNVLKKTQKDVLTTYVNNNNKNNNNRNNNNNNNNNSNNNKDNNNTDNNNGNYNENKLIIIATINLFNWRVILDNVF